MNMKDVQKSLMKPKLIRLKKDKTRTFLSPRGTAVKQGGRTRSHASYKG